MCLYVIRYCIEWLIEMSLDELSVSVVVDALVATTLPIHDVSVDEDGAIFEFHSLNTSLFQEIFFRATTI